THTHTHTHVCQINTADWLCDVKVITTGAEHTHTHHNTHTHKHNTHTPHTNTHQHTQPPPQNTNTCGSSSPLATLSIVQPTARPRHWSAGLHGNRRRAFRGSSSRLVKRGRCRVSIHCLPNTQT